MEYKDISTLPGYGRLRAVSLFLQILCEGSLRRAAARRETREEKRDNSFSFFVPLPFRAFSHARGRLRGLARFARCIKKKERLPVVYGYRKLP